MGCGQSATHKSSIHDNPPQYSSRSSTHHPHRHSNQSTEHGHKRTGSNHSSGILDTTDLSKSRENTSARSNRNSANPTNSYSAALKKRSTDETLRVQSRNSSSRHANDPYEQNGGRSQSVSPSHSNTSATRRNPHPTQNQTPRSGRFSSGMFGMRKYSPRPKSPQLSELIVECLRCFS